MNLHINKEEHILCAAVWYDDNVKRELQPLNIKSGIVVCGWRHGNCISILHSMFPNREYVKHVSREKQGFLTSKGRYVTRKEAGEIAFKAKQIEKENNCLFSEDLY